MKKIFSLLTVLAAAVMLTSCVVVTESGYVTIENRDSNRSAYISKVEYQDEGCSEWHDCWYYSKNHTDSNINFTLDSGYYKLRVTVIYPRYDGYYDYYDKFETRDYEYISTFTDRTYIFDGRCLYR